ncbi:MAG TPA: pilus assembly protein PilM [Candidatus Baltobacteraceae bacterium]|nr:pilus assembly protein PilM [Candidatus Baltobacteraceae bacterium]
MVKVRSLPLGVDIGKTRIRVAAAVRAASGKPVLVGVATSELPDDAECASAVLEDLRRELGTRERRCVLSLPASNGVLKVVRFPKMSDSERRHAARFESERIAPWDSKEIATVVRAHWVNVREGLVAIGVAREDALRPRVACARRAGLSVSGVDHDACAMLRAFPFADAVLDVGYEASSLHVFSASGLFSITIPVGGSEVTAGICRDLGIDSSAAERRKRILGTAGAGEAARDAFVGRAAAAIAEVRERNPIRRIAMTGNGARLPGLPEAMEAASGAMVDVPVSDLLRVPAYPDDVARSAAPDWTLAASLAAWETP